MIDFDETGFYKGFVKNQKKIYQHKSISYADPDKAIAMHVDGDDKLNDKTASSLGQRGGWFINESGGELKRYFVLNFLKKYD